MKLILKLDGAEAVIYLMAAQAGTPNSDWAPDHRSDFIGLMATLLANCWLDEQGLRQAA